MEHKSGEHKMPDGKMMSNKDMKKEHKQKIPGKFSPFKYGYKPKK